MKKADQDSYLQRLEKEKNSPAFTEFLAHYHQSKGCPVTRTLRVIGGKWKPILLYMIDHDVNRFGQLHQLIGSISKKMLAQQLRELEADRLLDRKVYEQLPAKVEYRLSEQGLTLRPIWEAMCTWGLEQSDPEQASA